MPGLLLWAMRDYLPDLWGGIFLKFNNIKELEIYGDPAQIVSIGSLISKLSQGEKTFRMKNRDVLDELKKKRDVPPE
ncbi:MAG: hypothetical protein GY754_03305 [bacterium]|nr:hypothetical protein [bacterium]